MMVNMLWREARDQQALESAKPMLFCTQDAVICTGNDELEKENVFLQLIQNHNPHRALSTYLNYTHFIKGATREFITQMHYISLNLIMVYANSTFLVQFVLIQIPDLAMLIGIDTLNIQCENLQKLGLFINSDGLIEQSVQCLNNQLTMQPFTGQNIFNPKILPEVLAILKMNNLSNSNKITFLTNEFQNVKIFTANTVQSQIGNVSYEQFEGTLMLLIIDLVTTAATSVDVIMEYVNRLNYTQPSEIKMEQESFDFKIYNKRIQIVDVYETDIMKYQTDHPDQFQDILDGEDSFGVNWAPLATCVLIITSSILIYYLLITPMSKQPYELILPVSKTKKIARITNPNHQLTQQGAQLLTFCGEFMTKFVLAEAEKEALKEGSKTISYANIRKVIVRTPGLAFLEDTVPEKFIFGEDQKEE